MDKEKKEIKKEKKNKKEKDVSLEKLNEAYNKISELEDKLIRQNADMVNYRKRKEEEINKMLKFCNEDIIKELLPIVDNFERAINNDDELSETEKNFLAGFKMIYCSILNILEKNDKLGSGMVIEVLQKGYLYKDKVIRPAMVKVSE